MTQSAKKIVSLILDILTFCLSLTGILLLGWKNPGQVFLFFTNDSNFFLFLTTIVFLVFEIRSFFGKEIPRAAYILSFLALIGVVLTFLVVLLVLAPIMAKSGGVEGYFSFFTRGNFLYFHLLCPVLATVSFFLRPSPKIERKAIPLSLLPVLCYGIPVLVLVLLRIVEPPYPFLDVYGNPVVLSVFSLLGILLAFPLSAFLLRLFKNRKTE